MSRIPVVLLAIGLTGGLAACGDTGGGDATTRDTTLTTVEDTVLIERSTTIDVDTVRDPDLDRDTMHHDTLHRDTVLRP